MFQGKRRCVVGSAFLAIAVCITSGIVRAQGVPLYPDIVEQIAHLQIQNEHQREMLRFSTTHINIGDGPLQSRGARFEVRKGTLDGPLVNNGVKITFCLVDTDQTDLVTKGSNRFYFDCNAELQGISVGWGDNYHQSTPLQELEITGIQ